MKEGALQSLLTGHSTWRKCPALSQITLRLQGHTVLACRTTWVARRGILGPLIWALGPVWRLGFSGTSLCHLSHSVSPGHRDGTAGHPTAQARHDKSELIRADKLFPDFLSLPYRCSQQFSLGRLTYAWSESTNPSTAGCRDCLKPC